MKDLLSVSEGFWMSARTCPRGACSGALRFSCAGIVKDQLMVRVGPEVYDRLLEEPHARKMDFTGRPMKGFLYVTPPGLESDADLERWVGRGVAFATALPAKGASRQGSSKRTVLTRRAPRGAGRGRRA